MTNDAMPVKDNEMQTAIDAMVIFKNLNFKFFLMKISVNIYGHKARAISDGSDSNERNRKLLSNIWL